MEGKLREEGALEGLEATPIPKPRVLTSFPALEEDDLSSVPCFAPEFVPVGCLYKGTLSLPDAMLTEPEGGRESFISSFSPN